MYYIRIWDLPTRVFHWALVACVLGLIITCLLYTSDAADE
jgi:cytochrome b